MASHDTLSGTSAMKELVCDASGWIDAQHMLFQFGNLFILLAFFTSHDLRGHMLHKGLISGGFFALAIWAWVIKCIPDAAVWNTFFGLQALVSVHIDLWKMLAFRFRPEVDVVYRQLFKKCGTSRYDFHRILSIARLENLSQGLIESRDKPLNKLRLVISGRVDVSRNHNLLYTIRPMEFIESVDMYDRQRDPIAIVEETRVLTWKTSKLSTLMQDPHLSAVWDQVLGHDISSKLNHLYVSRSRSTSVQEAAADKA